MIIDMIYFLEKRLKSTITHLYVYRLITPAKTKTYNSEDSLVVTHLTTNSPACGLSTAERTGSPVLHTLWSLYNGATNQFKNTACHPTEAISDTSEYT
ncbi:hypothetical protein N7512_007371 [Penicillium capsulatum]|nr:hypothetical protein N7512_007371 [Penicillium capsulatum]